MTTLRHAPASADALVRRLEDDGVLTDPRWREVFRVVPREMFVPVRAWACPDLSDTEPYPIDRDIRTEQWWRAVYGVASIVTQIDDGATDPATGDGAYSSSLSAPGIALSFLHDLDVHAHHRVLEIGTGTGWSAAALSWRTGAAEGIVTIEVDPEVAEQARRNLKRAGYEPHIVVGDGAAGRPEGAPYDRVHATCAASAVPYAWIEQTRPGGVVVLPWSPGFGYGHRLRLDVLDDGTAVGRITGPAVYMMLRSQRLAMGAAARWVHDDNAIAESSTHIDPRQIAYAPQAADLMIAALVPGVQSRIYHDTDTDSGEATFWILDAHDRHGSWASVDYEPRKDAYLVQQHGSRRLWDETADAWLRWLSLGRPGIDRFGLTVTLDGQHVWLDAPDNPIRTEAHRRPVRAAPVPSAPDVRSMVIRR